MSTNGVDPFGVTDHGHGDEPCARAERKADAALHLLTAKRDGVVPRVEQMERVLESIDGKAPPVAAVWTGVICLLLLTVFSGANMLLSIAR